MSWLKYLAAVIVFTVVGFVSLMAILMTQQWLPFNPMALPNLSWHLAFNTAWSFTCNADWQSYAGESTMSYLSQTLGLSVHQFLSGAAGIAVLVAVARALKRASLKVIGNFWTDSDALHPLPRHPAVGPLDHPARVAGRPADLETLCDRQHRRALHHAGAEDGRQGQCGQRAGR